MAYENVTPPALPDYNGGMCLYNGVELPDIDTVWTDKTTYPYATLFPTLSGGCRLFFTTTPAVYGTFTFSQGTETATYWYTEAGSVSTYIMCDFIDGAWGECELKTIDRSNATGHFLYTTLLTWTSYDVKNLDNDTIYLSASDPVPVLSYPYHVLVFDYGAKESDWYQVHLYYSATEFTYNGSAVTNAGVVFKQVYDDSIGAWTDYGELTEAVNLSPGLKDGVYQRIYTNHDILDGSGTVWLAADSVTPVEETGVTVEWIFSFKTGLALGLCGKALPWKAEPVAWLYNGVRLPKLPEWDKEKYPYAWIRRVGASFYYLHLYATPVVKFTSTNDYIGVREAEVYPLYSSLNGSSDVWGEVQTDDSARQLLGVAVWSNHDILSEDDGTVYLAASEPVPVYE